MRFAKIRYKLYIIKRFLLDILYPNRCPFCDEIIHHSYYHCQDNNKDCPLNSSDDFSPSENEATNKTPKSISIFDFNDTTSRFIYDLKDNGNGYAISAAAKLISDKIKAMNLDKNISLITCIPTDKKRLRKRGYNPPALIAKEISELISVKSNTNLIKKVRNTKTQKSLTISQRRENIKGAFAIRRKNHPLPENVLVVDDVTTTGATLGEAVKLLESAGVKNVYTAVVLSTKLKQ